MTSWRGQTGFGVWSVLFWVALVGVVAWLGARVFPLYYEYWTISQVFQEQVQKGSLYDSRGELQREVAKKLDFEDVDRLDRSEIQVEKKPTGQYRVFAEYQVAVPLSSTIQVVFTFSPEADEGG
ncbi:MAG: DUF4845 domain-containing protein [Thiohalorhabdus sp.]|uniref:DUF4845 domain-containing protein n=1 Tax=Thiohalorhabdus sp. TaxID=3094134 RepID=UPI0039816387